MNIFSKTLTGGLLVLALAFISSCTRVCDLGYEGDHCVTRVTDKYLGTFSGKETCGSVTDSFNVAITEVAGDVSKIKIYNVHNVNLNAIGTVLDNGSIAIASQSFGTGNISGSVTLVGGKKSISYLIVASGYPDASCTWVQN